MAEFAFGEEYGASEDEPTGEETPEELEALERRKALKAHQRAVEAAAAAGVAPPPPPAPPQGSATPNVDAAALMAQALVAKYTNPQPPPPQFPTNEPQSLDEALQSSESLYMNLVDKRLAIASLYRTLLNGSLFQGEDPSEEVKVVEDEVKAFVRDRLGVLMGIASDTPKKGQLTEEELAVVKLLVTLTPLQIQAVKIFADKVVAAGALQDEPAPAAAKPTPVPAPKPAAPTIRPRVVTQPQLAPRQAPQQPQIAQQPVPAQQQPQAAPPRRGPGRPPGSKNKLTQMVQAVRKHPDGSEEPLYNEDGSPRMVPVKRIQRPAGALPFPSEEAMGALMQQQAVTTAAARVASPEVTKALTAMANTPSDE